jgi:hypothetical protein
MADTKDFSPAEQAILHNQQLLMLGVARLLVEVDCNLLAAKIQREFITAPDFVALDDTAREFALKGD